MVVFMVRNKKPDGLYDLKRLIEEEKNEIGKHKS